MNYLTIILTCLFAYLCGSIPSGVWIGQYFYHIDIRTVGSGNSGTTNTFRVLGKKAGIIVFLFDMIKGTIPVVLAQTIVPVAPFPVLIVGIFALIGHTFPIFAGFKGGKAVATTAGMMLGIHPLLVLLGTCVFIACLLYSRMVSLSSMISISSGVIMSLWYGDWLLTGLLFIIDCFIIYRHRDNIARIRQGTENKIPAFWQKNKED